LPAADARVVGIINTRAASMPRRADRQPSPQILRQYRRIAADQTRDCLILVDKAIREPLGLGLQFGAS
jgi:hypothetical protein